jgi:hypothetical protein
MGFEELLEALRRPSQVSDTTNAESLHPVSTTEGGSNSTYPSYPETTRDELDADSDSFDGILWTPSIFRHANELFAPGSFAEFRSQWQETMTEYYKLAAQNTRKRVRSQRLYNPRWEAAGRSRLYLRYAQLSRKLTTGKSMSAIVALCHSLRQRFDELCRSFHKIGFRTGFELGGFMIPVLFNALDHLDEVYIFHLLFPC